MLYILGVMFWLLWFFFLFIIALPQIDNWLQKSSERLKKTARKIVIIVVIIGIVECIGLAVIGLDTIVSKQGEHFPEVLTSLNESFNYNDATALCHQAAENFLDGKNPYAEAHIVNAMQEYDVPLHKLTPLRLGIFTDTFPYPQPMSKCKSCINEYWKIRMTFLKSWNPVYVIRQGLFNSILVFTSGNKRPENYLYHITGAGIALCNMVVPCQISAFALAIIL